MDCMLYGLIYNYDTPREDVAVLSHPKSQVIGRGFQVWLW